MKSLFDDCVDRTNALIQDQVDDMAKLGLTAKVG